MTRAKSQRLKINVIQEDIDNADKLGDSRTCPIAQSTMREHGWTNPWVDWDAVHNDTGKDVIIYRMPKKASNFIDRFDDDKEVKPISFYIYPVK